MRMCEDPQYCSREKNADLPVITYPSITTMSTLYSSDKKITSLLQTHPSLLQPLRHEQEEGK